MGGIGRRVLGGGRGLCPGWGWVRGEVEVELGSEGSGVGAGVVVGVADQALERVDPGRWTAPGDGVDHFDCPESEVNVGVVAAADEGEVGHVGASAVAEVLHVVGFAV